MPPPARPAARTLRGAGASHRRVRLARDARGARGRRPRDPAALPHRHGAAQGRRKPRDRSRPRGAAGARQRRSRASSPSRSWARRWTNAEQRRIWEAGGRFWCVDPLDGTANFSAGVPYFAVSVALMQDDRPVFGAVVDPIADEAYFAVRGAGAWRDGFPLRAAVAGDRRSRRPWRRSTCAARLAHVRHEIKHRPPFARRAHQRLVGARVVPPRRRPARPLPARRAEGLGLRRRRPHRARRPASRLATLARGRLLGGPAWERSVIAARTPALFAGMEGLGPRTARRGPVPRNRPRQ